MSYEQWLKGNYTCPKCGKPCTVCDYECDYIIRAEDKWLKNNNGLTDELKQIVW